MVEDIRSIRDLLIFLLAPDLRRAVMGVKDELGRDFAKDMETFETIAGAMIDSLQPRALELLAERQADEERAQMKKAH